MRKPKITAQDVENMRGSMGLSQKAFGDLLGVSERTVRNLETAGPSEGSLQMFALQALMLLLDRKATESAPKRWTNKVDALVGRSDG